MKPLVSVIIPVYKTEQYIHQSVNSVLAQTYANLEVILVDDGSPDRCGEICDAYASKDSRIRVIHKENGGLSSARQAGISAATGEYLFIVDSDDWIEPDMTEQCLSIAVQNQSDCVLYSYVKEYPEKSIPVHLFQEDFHYSSAEAKELVHRRLIGPVGEELRAPQRAEFLSSVCMKFYRMEVARKGRIVSEREVGSNEDGIFNLYALEQCSVSYIDRCFYHYRKTNPNSITTRYRPDLTKKWDVMYGYLQAYVSSSGDSVTLNQALLNRIACGMISLGINEMSAKAGLITKARRIRKILCKDTYRKAFAQLTITHCPIHWKIFFVLCKLRAAFPLVILLRVMDYLRARMSA